MSTKRGEKPHRKASRPKTEEERYIFTPLGLLQSAYGEEAGREIFDKLELYARRMLKIGDPAIIFIERGGLFSSVEKVPEDEQAPKEPPSESCSESHLGKLCRKGCGAKPKRNPTN